jgi:hypothetical protein
MEMVLPNGVGLRPVGFFEELGFAIHYTEKIRDAVQDRAAPNEQKVISYLNGGYVLLDVPETAVDVIAGKGRIIGGSSLVSDGTWVWRRDLAYYVGKYHLRLPAEFLDHLIQRKYVLPVLSEQDLERVGNAALRFF